MSECKICTGELRRECVSCVKVNEYELDHTRARDARCCYLCCWFKTAQMSKKGTCIVTYLNFFSNYLIIFFILFLISFINFLLYLLILA
jgi:hypothetical protein